MKFRVETKALLSVVNNVSNMSVHTEKSRRLNIS